MSSSASLGRHSSPYVASRLTRHHSSSVAVTLLMSPATPFNSLSFPSSPRCHCMLQSPPFKSPLPSYVACTPLLLPFLLCEILTSLKPSSYPGVTFVLLSPSLKIALTLPLCHPHPLCLRSSHVTFAHSHSPCLMPLVFP